MRTSRPEAIREPPTPWLDRWRGARDALLAGARFQRWAAAFPLTRPVARREVRGLFDLCAGFVYSQVLFACVRLRLFDILADGALPLAALSARLALSEAAADRLLRAAISLQLVERRGEQFGLGARGAAIVGNPGIAAMVEHHALLYADLRDPIALLRGEHTDTELSRLWPYAGDKNPAELRAEEVAGYSALMAASQPMVAQEILAAYPLRRHSCLLDVGGGEGAFLAAAAKAAPALRLILFDLPAVAERARNRLAAGGLAGRVRVEAGDFLRDPLPSGADAISLVRIVHDHDDGAAVVILRAVHAALPPGGVLILAEPMAGTPDAEPIGDAYFGFYLLAMGSGRPRTETELRTLLAAAGFGKVRHLRTRIPLLVSVLVATAEKC